MGRVGSTNGGEEEYLEAIGGNAGRKETTLDNIIMVLREMGWDGVDWIDLAQDRDQ
jgi:hypothetical protein